MTTEKQMNQPLIWPSLARIAATGAIFIFHYQGLFRYYQYHLDFYAILTFCFLSGYLARIDKTARWQWLIIRYFSIMVPYWLVIIPVIIINEIVKYKSVSFFEYAVTIAGGNMFLENPLYVIAWYITFVLILYAYVFIESFFRSYSLVACMAIAALVLTAWFGKTYYFVAFFIGLRLSSWWSQENSSNANRLRGYLSSWLFVAQRYCYSFFLVHGAVLLFFTKLVTISSLAAFFGSFLFSIVLSVVIFMIGKPISIIAGNKAVSLDMSYSGQLLRAFFIRFFSTFGGFRYTPPDR